MSAAPLTIAVRAARRAGDFLQRSTRDLSRVNVEEKGTNDFVSDIDREAERLIAETVLDAYPDHAFLGEEGGSHGDSAHRWIVDPLDGTTNYLHGLPWYAVSIGYEVDGRLAVGVVYVPESDELFTAVRGQGAQLNNRRIRVAPRTGLKGALLATGFPFRHFDDLDRYLETLGAVISETSGVRRAGSAALDLAYVAAGRFDGFWEIGLKPWDIAAGTLLIQEAGGLVSDFQGGQGFMESGNVVAANAKIFRALLTLLASHRKPERPA